MAHENAGNEKRKNTKTFKSTQMARRLLKHKKKTHLKPPKTQKCDANRKNAPKTQKARIAMKNAKRTGIIKRRKVD